MDAVTLTEALSAAHLSWYVEGATHDRGGIMLVAPAGSLKTSITEVTDSYGKTLVISDLTIRQAAQLRGDMLSGKLATLAFSDFAKLYARHEATAANIEGFIRGIVGEGYRNVNWEDARAVALPAHCLVLGCMTSNFYTNKFGQWCEDGFARRFLWCHFTLSRKGSMAITHALSRGKRLQIGAANGFDAKVPIQPIPENVTDREAAQLLLWIKGQPDDKIQIVLLRKMLTALKWKYKKDPKKPMKILAEFAMSLRKEGTELEIVE